MDHKTNEINFTIGEITDATTELYEAMFEEDNDKEINDICKRMILQLKDIQDSLDKSKV